MGGVGILGGTFNPVHTGHIRHAVEVGEALGLEKVYLTPCAVPPHKPDAGLLPYALRADLLREAVDGIPLLDVSTLESELAGPSYTYNLLAEWRRRHPRDEAPYFLMGAEDFAALDTWYQGVQLPRLARLVVASRSGADRETFYEGIRRLWPGEYVPAGEPDKVEAVTLAGGGQCLFLSVPRLDISASLVRERWLAGRDIHGLVPEGVRCLLDAYRADVAGIWRR